MNFDFEIDFGYPVVLKASDSVKFHKKLGYSMVGEFHKCGYKFGRWYHMIWMEKMIGEHVGKPKEIVPHSY